MTLHQARMASAQCWLRVCGIDFVLVNGAKLELKVGDVGVSWDPSYREWVVFDDEGTRGVYMGTQPEFAVFLRQLRDGRLSA